jgi:drug/metabolite transporter (DMT)-like permease
MKNNNSALIALVLVQLFYGVTFTFANDVIDGGYIQPYGFILFRVSLAAVLFWIFSLWTPKEKIERSDYPKFMTAAFFGVALNMLAFFKGLQFTTPINGSVIMVTTPIIVLVLSAIIFSEKITKLKVLGILAGLSGALILSLYNPSTRTGDHVLLGNFLVLINAASYSYYLILIKKITAKYHPYTFIKWLFLFGTLFVLPFGYKELFVVDWGSFTPYIWFSALFVVVCATFATYLLNPMALRKLSATTVSTFVYVQPVFAGIFAIMMGSDSLNVVKVIAASLIFLGVYLVSKTPNPQADK